MSRHNHIQKDYHHTAWSSHPHKFSPVEKLTIPLDKELVELVDETLPFESPHSKVFDNSCGHGALSSIIKARYPSVHLLATDASPGMFDKKKARASRESWRHFDARVLDSRKLDGVPDDHFTHTLSAFMICLVQDPHLIMQEMYRVTKPGGVLGIANWGTLYYDCWERPWAKACKRIDDGYEPTMLMSPEWTVAKEIKENIQQVGFKDVTATEKTGTWGFEDANEALRYFFDGGNPGCVKMLQELEHRGQSLEEVRPISERALLDEYGDGKGGLMGTHYATFVIARK
ncbi:MAG: hypothetical protein Q9181_001550 [Wetmoreana brouardii]